MTQKEYVNIIYEKKDKVATITLNRPKALNALSLASTAEMRDAFQDAENDEDINVIVLTGAGDRAFCAGADISEFEQLSAIGARDYSLALQGFGQPEVNLAVIPGAGGTQRLTRLVGKAKAMELDMLGEMIDAAEAHRLGLVNQVVPAEELDKAVDELIQKLLSKSSVILGIIKLAVNKGIEMDLDRALFYEAECFGSAFGTEDSKEGAKAFLEKRKAEFKGR